MYSHRHVILHLPAKFRNNRTNGGGVMTSYRFFKMAAIKSEMYFRDKVWWRDLFKEVEIYLPTKFRWDILIHGWDKTTSENGRPPFWNSISGFDFDVRIVIGMSFCICLPNFVVIRRWWAELWLYIYFFKMAVGSHIGFDLGNVRPPTKCNCRSQLDPQIWFWSDL